MEQQATRQRGRASGWGMSLSASEATLYALISVMGLQRGLKLGT